MSVKALPFPVFTERILLHYETLRERSTLQRMRQICKVLTNLKHNGKPVVKSTRDLTSEMVLYFIQARRAAPVCENTIIGELGYLKALCNFAVDRDCLEKVPFRPRQKMLRPEPLKRRTHLTIEEAARYLDHLGRNLLDWRGHRLYALAATYAYTGVRRNEGLYAWVEDVDLDVSILHLVERDERFKTVGSAAPVGIPPELAEILRRWMPRCGSRWLFPGATGVGPWTGGSKGYKPLDRIKITAEEVGLTDVTIQCFRHTWATAAEWWGISRDGVQEQLRHADVKTQVHYRHEDLVRRAHAVRGVSFRQSQRKHG